MLALTSLLAWFRPRPAITTSKLLQSFAEVLSRLSKKPYLMFSILFCAHSGPQTSDISIDSFGLSDLKYGLSEEPHSRAHGLRAQR